MSLFFPPIPGSVLSPNAPAFVPVWFTPDMGSLGENNPSLQPNDLRGNALEVAIMDRQDTDEVFHSLKALTEMASFSEVNNPNDFGESFGDDMEDLMVESPLEIDISNASTSLVKDEETTEWETDGASLSKSDYVVAPVNAQSRRITRSVTYTKASLLEKQAREGLTQEEEIRLQLFMPSPPIHNLDFDILASPKKRKGKGKTKKRK